MTVMSGIGESSGGDGEEFIINHENEAEDGDDGDEVIMNVFYYVKCVIMKTMSNNGFLADADSGRE